MSALLEISDLCRDFGAFRAVDCVSLQLNAGEVLGFLGPNGAGKSSTMRMICGTLAPSSGQIRIDGTDLLSDPMSAKRALGYLPENPPIYPELSVDEYLRYTAELRGMGRDRIDDAVSRVKRECGLESRGRQLISNLSSGYRQRVGIAQALVHEPKLVILDEPTNGLDPNQVREIRTLIRQLGEHRAVILCSHILTEIEAVCDRVMIIHQGRVVMDAPMACFETAPGDYLRISLPDAPTVEAVLNLHGIDTVEQISDIRFRLRLVQDQDSASVLKQMVELGWPVDEMYWEKSTLEHRFTQLTSMESGG